MHIIFHWVVQTLSIQDLRQLLITSVGVFQLLGKNQHHNVVSMHPSSYSKPASLIFAVTQHDHSLSHSPSSFQNLSNRHLIFDGAIRRCLPSNNNYQRTELHPGTKYTKLDRISANKLLLV